jgi:hypothetical protein
MIKRHYRSLASVAALLAVAALAFLLGVANGHGGATASGPEYPRACQLR